MYYFVYRSTEPNRPFRKVYDYKNRVNTTQIFYFHFLLQIIKVLYINHYFNGDGDGDDTIKKRINHEQST